jgi:hypothetical protein
MHTILRAFEGLLCNNLVANMKKLSILLFTFYFKLVPLLQRGELNKD